MALLQCVFTAALLATGSLAQDILKDLSFGYDKTLSPNSFGIPNWSMLGEGHVPQLLSDKVILTPPYGGNKRGALWTEKQNNLQEWTVDFEFRANGQDRSMGNLDLWYAKDGSREVSTSSVYTVGKFDGLALHVDTTGGVQRIRGFLNDGTLEYRSHPNVDGLAFGHCDYAYRNLGRPSKIRISSTSAGLAVTIDDQPCFSSSSISLPHDYTFGMTASSSDPPDSFEAFKFIVRSNSPSIAQPVQNNDWAQQLMKSMAAASDDKPASDYTTSQAQFEDLHSRLTLLSKSITNLFAEITRHTAAEEARYQEILRLINSNSNANLERLIRDLDHKPQFAKLSDQLAQTHNSMTEHLPNRMREAIQNHTPRIGFIVFSFIGFQCALVVAYVMYKRRRAQAPKKYL